ncbi:MAG TPA: hypothetical protein VJ723_10740 [Candidatus Angelobacter sp.]|nr:hypothetical protein [Candidatus Angelobacter sp.]
MDSDCRALCRKWNWIVLCSAGIIAAIVVAGNYRANFYGLFGNVRGKGFIVHDNERITKYLFSYNYIPTNFDGLLIGSSISENWDTKLIRNFRVYNASLRGANISEEALIADNVLTRSRPRIWIVLIFPALTLTHGRRSGYMNPQEYWGALGSIQLFRAYGNKWLTSLRHANEEFNDFGCKDYQEPSLRLELKEVSEFVIDSRSLKEYSDLLQRARSQGVRIVGVIPPIEMERSKLERQAFESYNAKVRTFFLADEPIIDLNDPALESLRMQKDNFPNGYHLSKAAADQVVRVIDARLKGLNARD